MDLALFLEEFGNNPPDDDVILSAQLRGHRSTASDSLSGRGRRTVTHAWGFFNPPTVATESSGCMRVSREELLAAVRGFPAILRSITRMARSGQQPLRRRQAGKASTAVTLRHKPPVVAGGGAVRLLTSSETDGSRLVFAVPTGGEFQVTVAAATRRLTPCA
jgi:hypothetical protein